MAEHELGDVSLGTSVDLDGLDKGLAAGEAKAKIGFGKIGDILKGALTVGIAAGAAALGIGIAQIAGGVEDARAAAQVMAQTQAVIESTGGAAGVTADQVADMAASLSAAEGKSLFGDDQIQAAANTLIQYKELKGLIPDITQLSVDMATRLGTEPAAAAEALGRALAKPEEAQGRLARMGIVLTDAENGVIKAMVDAGDTAGAQRVLLDKLNTTYAGSAQAAADADGGFAQLNDRWGELMETVGARVLPVVTQFVSLLNDSLMPTIETGVDPAIAGMGATFNDEVLPVLSELGEHVLPVLQTAWEGLGWLWSNVIGPALQLLWFIFKNLLVPVITFTADLLSGPLARGARGLVQGFTDFFAVAGTVVGWLVNIAQAVWNVINGIEQFKRDLGSVIIPDWLEGHSPPPMAEWFGFIGDAAGMASDQAGDFAALATPDLTGFGGSAPALNRAGALGASGMQVDLTINRQGLDWLNRLIDVRVQETNRATASDAGRRGRSG